jgi:transketolase
MVGEWWAIRLASPDSEVHLMTDPAAVKDLARRVRRDVLRMVHLAGASHVGSSLSVVDILASLYGGILRVKSDDPDWEDRDRLILSKGHSGAALNAVLAECGFFDKSWLEHYCENGAQLAGHVTHQGVPGVELSTGSLGHGLPVACGMAIHGKRLGRPYRVITILSDGECDEGSVWESALLAPQHGLDNLVVIIDYNKIQSLGDVADVIDLDPLADKWRSFRWAVTEVDGHDVEETISALENLPLEPGRPTCLIAHTVKGKGVSFMENQLAWHYRSPDADQLTLALDEIGDPS